MLVKKMPDKIEQYYLEMHTDWMQYGKKLKVDMAPTRNVMIIECVDFYHVWVKNNDGIWKKI
jgi:hypothetical protein